MLTLDHGVDVNLFVNFFEFLMCHIADVNDFAGIDWFIQIQNLPCRFLFVHRFERKKWFFYDVVFYLSLVNLAELSLTKKLVWKDKVIVHFANQGLAGSRIGRKSLYQFNSFHR